jgi:hypothetical protein
MAAKKVEAKVQTTVFKKETLEAFSFELPADFTTGDAANVLAILIPKKGAYAQAGYIAGARPPCLFVVCLGRFVETYKQNALAAIEAVRQGRELEKLKQKIGVR